MVYYDATSKVFAPSVDKDTIALNLGALSSVTTGTKNTAIGARVLDVVTTGSNNTGLGVDAGGSITTGSSNVCIGNGVGSTTLTTGSNNILIGTSSAVTTVGAATSNTLNIGGAITATNLGSSPVVTIPGTLSVSGGVIDSGVAIQSAQFNAVTGTTGATLTNLTGMSVAVVPGTYKFYINLPGVSTANCGIKTAFKYTGTVVGSIEAIGRGFTASAVAVQHTTTATDQAALFAQTAAVIDVVVEGTMVVTTGGTVQMQAAQNAAHADTTSVYAGAYMQFTRIV